MPARTPVVARILAALLLLIGIVIALGGIKLLTLGGARYYLAGGLAVAGRQFVVVAAGGHINLQSTPLSDTFVAFALPETK